MPFIDFFGGEVEGEHNFTQGPCKHFKLPWAAACLQNPMQKCFHLKADAESVTSCSFKATLKEFKFTELE